MRGGVRVHGVLNKIKIWDNYQLVMKVYFSPRTRIFLEPG